MLPKVTYGMIVLNGEPFIRYNLRALYRFAHEIIVVEGAVRAAADIATPDGHSTDGTLHTLRSFKDQEDCENKLIIITAEDEGYPDGFWPGEKHEQSHAYAKRATGEYLWQIDVDEFYKPEDMGAVLEMLRREPNITAVSFKSITFWGGFDYITNGWYLRRGAEIYHRLFKWGPGHRYVTHRPPTVHDSQGRDLRELKWVNGYQLAQQGIFLYHYSLVFPKQVQDKCNYYSQAEWATHARASREWAQRNFLHLEEPFRVHNVYAYPSWLERFVGSHPTQIEEMRKDIAAGRLRITTRRVDDIECLLSSRYYLTARALLKFLYYGHRLWKDHLGPRCNRARWLMMLPLRSVGKGWRLMQRIIK
ncbi:MAG: glycosyltransferase family A protein [bacterium]